MRNPIDNLFNAATAAYVEACELETYGLIQPASVDALLQAVNALRDLQKHYARQLTPQPRKVTYGPNVVPFPERDFGNTVPKGAA